jgi:hypothetical protein
MPLSSAGAAYYIDSMPRGRAAPFTHPIQDITMRSPLMPKATAVWLVENTSLTFDQIADFCGLHPLEVQAIADGEVATQMLGLDPVANGQTTAEELVRCQADPEARLKLLETAIPPQYQRHKGPRYTPIAKRQDKPDAILYLLRNHPELSDAQICKLVGTTKPTINAVRDRSHWNSPNLKARHPVGLELCTLEELDQAVTKATRGKKSLADIEAEIAARAAEAEDVEA